MCVLIDSYIHAYKCTFAQSIIKPRDSAVRYLLRVCTDHAHALLAYYR